jgi:cell wall-associated NlpC family hydrolase
MPARPLRRLVAVSACLASLLLFPQAASALGTAGWTVRGEAGSGPPTWTAPRALSPGDPTVTWSDVDGEHWAREAIDFVASSNRWMRDSKPQADGTTAFKPDGRESRKLFARALLRAFGAGSPQEPALVFPDLAGGDRFYVAANVAVTAGWMTVDEQGAFRPGEPVTMREVHRALVHALGFGDLADAADALHLRNGTPIAVPQDFGTTLIGMRIGLRYNHGDESLDVGPDSQLSRAEVAWSLYRAATVPTWMHDDLSPYLNFELPNLGTKMQQVVAFAVRYVGYPYVWGGEWYEPASSGYCCGYQPVGGFDCSGFTWWVMKSAVEGWDPTPVRGYPGWELPQRTSASMASVGGQVPWDELVPGDLLFYDGDGNGTVDHVNTYLGNGWAMDTGSSNGGTTITSVTGNWYEDHFVHGRRILG